jgi:hypothetical protein
LKKILHIQTPTYQAQAVFEKRGRDWACISASDQALHWMPGCSPGFIKIWLKRNNHVYRWEAAPAAQAGSGKAIPSAAGSV